MINWEWKDGNSVVVSGPKLEAAFEWLIPSVSKIRAYEFELEKARRTYVILETAKDSFEGGRARYEDASANVRNLIEEANKAAIELIEVLKRSDQWFDAPPSASFDGNADAHLAFVKEWLSRLGHSPEVVGNSSREPLGNSPQGLPKTAEIAKDSSLIGKDNPRGSASRKSKGSSRRTADVVRSS